MKCLGKNAPRPASSDHELIYAPNSLNHSSRKLVETHSNNFVSKSNLHATATSLCNYLNIVFDIFKGIAYLDIDSQFYFLLFID